MSTKYLGETFDLHGGGLDLIFPHHENELAQSKALGGEFVRYWMHNGLLNLEGQKMSKSTGHFFAMDEVLAEFEPEVVRFYLLRGQFRNQMEYSRERLAEAKAAYERMQRVLVRLEELVRDPELGTEIPAGLRSAAAVGLLQGAEKARTGFREALCDDFNAEAALAALFELVRELNPYLVARSRAAQVERDVVEASQAVLRESMGVLGLFTGLEVGSEIPPEIQEMALRREAARADRDWGTADTLRDELVARGWSVEDGPEGTKLRPL
jgi:cysteinyl-tRNA synthetase